MALFLYRDFLPVFEGKYHLTIAVENEFADNMYQRSELDWLIYNKPLEYAQLVLEGDPKKYVQGTPEHRLMD